ncbi:phospho-N-acetylmuramoyl-pentapeptide-transferase [Candidatus Peregrinibacteria bacterium]|nr:phospho-N-acetylmuramoyl-pentapeptide-transferase [Candidatus Peregrinibacteria bacterium]
MTHIPQLIWIFSWTIFCFLITLLLTPLFLRLVDRLHLKKTIRDTTMDGKAATIFRELHLKKTGTPTMGGVIIWGAIIMVILFSRLLALMGIIQKSLLDRGEVYLPLFTLLAVGILGAVDDLLNIKGVGGQKGMNAVRKFAWLTLFGLLGAAWFYFKLDFSSIHIPRVGDFEIGWLYIPLFVLVIVSTANAVNFTDGLDGLAGGLLILAFATFGAIAYAKGMPTLAAFCGVVIGALLAFLWHNIPPALFYMGDTGALALGATLGVIAMMTNSLVILIIAGILFVVETISVILQLTWKKCFHRKLFLIAPLHHHFEKKGWGEAKITMRFWIIGAMASVIGLIIGLIGMGH